MSIESVKLSDIDPDIIPLIRKISVDSQSYKGLEFSILQDGQKNPILIRELTDEEKSKARENAVFGIIDGHNRFNIAKNNNFDSVLAEIEKRNPDDNNNYLDIILAYRLNESSIKMSTIEKGRIIFQLKEQQKEKTVPEIGREVFNLSKSMSYRLVNEYNKSIGNSTIDKTRENGFNSEIFNDIFNKISKNVDSVSESDYEEQLELIKTAQQQLRFLKSLLDTKFKK